MWFIGVEVVEQETSAPPPKKNPGSASDSDTFFLEIGRNSKFLLTTMFFFFILKNILQHQQCVESLLRAFEPIRIPSPVTTFAVIPGLVLMRLQNFFFRN